MPATYRDLVKEAADYPIGANQIVFMAWFMDWRRRAAKRLADGATVGEVADQSGRAICCIGIT